MSPYLGLANLILCFCFCLRLCFAPMPINTFLCLSSYGDQTFCKYIAYCLLLITYCYCYCVGTESRQDSMASCLWFAALRSPRSIWFCADPLPDFSFMCCFRFVLLLLPITSSKKKSLELPWRPKPYVYCFCLLLITYYLLFFRY